MDIILPFEKLITLLCIIVALLVFNILGQLLLYTQLTDAKPSATPLPSVFDEMSLTTPQPTHVIATDEASPIGKHLKITK